jgi:hypothetical protein
LQYYISSPFLWILLDQFDSNSTPTLPEGPSFTTMTVSYAEIISIVQIVVFTPALLLAILLAVRHGFGRSSGWIFMITFSILRIVGAIFAILVDTSDSPSQSIITGEIICQSVGLAPLTLILLGMLGRA